MKDGLPHVRWGDGTVQVVEPPLTPDEVGLITDVVREGIAPIVHGDPSGQTPTESGSMASMDTEAYDPNYQPEEPGEPEPLDPRYVTVANYLSAETRDGAAAPPNVRDAFNDLMGRLNTAEDELALERLRADSAVGTARALRDRAERVEAAVKAAIAELRGGDSMETEKPGTTETQVTEDTHREETTKEQPAQPGEHEGPSEDGPAQNDH